MGSPQSTAGPETSDLRYLNLHIFHSEMASTIFHWLQDWRVFLISLVILASFTTPTNSRSSYSRCLRTCVHCKEMYGKFFLGHLCARPASTSEGNSKPSAPTSRAS